MSGKMKAKWRAYRKVAKQAADIMEREQLGIVQATRLAADQHNAEVKRMRDEWERCTCKSLANGTTIAQFDPDCPVLSTHRFTPGRKIGWTRPVVLAERPPDEAWTQERAEELRGQRFESTECDGRILAVVVFDDGVVQVHVDPDDSAILTRLPKEENT